MAAPTQRWYFTREQLQNTPSRKCGVEPEKELSYRQQSANLIQDMGQRLQVNQLCINTAIVYMHRFYMFQSFTRFPRNSIAAACLFMAAKVEEQPHKLEHVLKVAHLCLHRGGPPLDPKSDTYMQQSQELVINESIILQTFAFDVAVSHPHTHVVKCTQMIRASKDLAQTSYFMATNSLHLTTFCLQYKPTIVACVCVHLACKWSQYEIPKSSDGNYWWEYVHPNVNRDLLDQLTMEFLQIIEACPNRLKRRITLHKEQTTAAKKNRKDGGFEEGMPFNPGAKPGSQSSIDSGFADLNDELSKHLLLPPNVGSPWLTKHSMDEDHEKPDETDMPLGKGNFPEPPQPAKKSLEEYRQQKEKERKIQEQKKEERSRQEKIKHEKRKAYEAQMREKAAHEGKVRPKMPPRHHPGERPTHHPGERPGHHPGERPGHHPGERPGHHPGERPVHQPGERPVHHPGEKPGHHPGERPVQHPSKVKLESGGDPNVRHVKEHVPNSDKEKRHRNLPPNMMESGAKPQHPHKRPLHPGTPQPLPPTGKDSRHPVHSKEHARGSVPIKERLEDRKSAEGKARTSGTHKPHLDVRKPHSSPVVQKPQVKKDPPLVKSESTSLLHKPQLLREKSQAQKDEEQKLNDELSDIRDEIMKELENDASVDTVTRPDAPPSAPVVKKRNSLDNLRQVAREELMQIKKSGIESKPLMTNVATVDNKPNRSHTELKPPVRLKEESKPETPTHASSHLSPAKLLKSPIKVKKERSTKMVSPLTTGKGDSPVSKKRSLDLQEKSQPVQKSMLQNIKKVKNSAPIDHSQTEETLPPLYPDLEAKFNRTSEMLMEKRSLNRDTKGQNVWKGKESENKLSDSISPDKKNVKASGKEQLKSVTHSSIHEEEEHSIIDTKIKEHPLKPTSVLQGETNVKRTKEEHTVQKGVSAAVKTEVKPAKLIVSEPKDVNDPQSALPGTAKTLQMLKASAGPHQHSPKQKHKHKDKKKHKKHRQEKLLESAGSPNVESTSILTTSGGIKLKIKGLSSSFSGSPGEPAKASPKEQNSSGNLSMKLSLAASPNSGKEHKHRHKHGKSKSHKKDGDVQNRKRSLSPITGSEASVVPAKRRAALDGESWTNSHPELPGTQSLLSLPMPPPDPKKSSPAKHSSSRHKRKHIIPPPPPPPKSGKGSPPPPPPPPRPEMEPSSHLTTVTALPSMDAMPLDMYATPNQYYKYSNLGNVMPHGNGSVPHQSSSRGRKLPPYS